VNTISKASRSNSGRFIAVGTACFHHKSAIPAAIGNFPRRIGAIVANGHKD
jgi:hypothetical protein